MSAKRVAFSPGDLVFAKVWQCLCLYLATSNSACMIPHCDHQVKGFPAWPARIQGRQPSGEHHLSLIEIFHWITFRQIWHIFLRDVWDSQPQGFRDLAFQRRECHQVICSSKKLGLYSLDCSRFATENQLKRKGYSEGMDQVSALLHWNRFPQVAKRKNFLLLVKLDPDSQHPGDSTGTGRLGRSSLPRFKDQAKSFNPCCSQKAGENVGWFSDSASQKRSETRRTRRRRWQSSKAIKHWGWINFFTFNSVQIWSGYSAQEVCRRGWVRGWWGGGQSCRQDHRRAQKGLG